VPKYIPSEWIERCSEKEIDGIEQDKALDFYLAHYHGKCSSQPHTVQKSKAENSVILIAIQIAMDLGYLIFPTELCG